jgi:hypothetical protein
MSGNANSGYRTTLERRLERYAEAIEVFERGEGAPRLRQIVPLLLAGCEIGEIQERLGCGRSVIYSFLNDPTRQHERERKIKFYGECMDCGAPTAYRVMPTTAKRCLRCHHAYVHAGAEARYIDAIREWNRLYGQPPSAMDWNVAMARHHAHPERFAEILRRQRERDWPVASGVVAFFGTWNAAIEAAGFTAMSAGGDRRRHDEWLEHVRDGNHRRWADAAQGA